MRTAVKFDLLDKEQEAAWTTDCKHGGNNDPHRTFPRKETRSSGELLNAVWMLPIHHGRGNLQEEKKTQCW